MRLNLRERFAKLWPRKQKPVPEVPGLTPDQAELLRNFEVGRSLQELSMLPGWKILLDIIEEIAFDSFYELTNLPISAQPDTKALYHCRARTMSEMYDQVMLRVQEYINAAEQVPAILAAQTWQPNEIKGEH